MMDATAPSHPRIDALIQSARNKGRLSVAVAYPCSPDSLAAALSARDEGIIDPILVGPRQRMEACAAILKTSLDGVRIVEAEDNPLAASHAAANLVGAGAAQTLMKGSQHTDELLGAVVSRDANLRTTRRMSHVFWFDLPNYHKPLMITDAVVNIAPALKDKVTILENVIDFAHAIGHPKPKIAMLSAVEYVNSNISSSVDAGELAAMGKHGYFKDAVVEGPFGFDNAVSKEAARIKGMTSEVAGDPDVLMIPNLDVGNTLYKSFIYMGGGECAGVVLGAKVPIILTSRADSQRARIASCALAHLSLT